MRRLVLCLVVLMVGVATAVATTLPDPEMILDPNVLTGSCVDSKDGGITFSPQDVTSPFTFSNTSSNSTHNSFFFCFRNADSFVWTSLSVDLTKLPTKYVPGQITCLSDAAGALFFSLCNQTVVGGFVTTLVYSNASSGDDDDDEHEFDFERPPGGGIPPGAIFALDLHPPSGCTGGTCDWAGGTFGAAATGVPEPGTMALLATGAIALLRRRRRL